jgi:hypothetical protein
MQHKVEIVAVVSPHSHWGDVTDALLKASEPGCHQQYVGSERALDGQSHVVIYKHLVGWSQSVGDPVEMSLVPAPPTLVLEALEAYTIKYLETVGMHS